MRSVWKSQPFQGRLAVKRPVSPSGRSSSRLAASPIICGNRHLVAIGASGVRPRALIGVSAGQRGKSVKTLILGIALLLSATVYAKAQTAKDLIGTWSLVSVTAQEPNGPITNDFGPNPQGRLNFDANGNYSLMVMAGDLPKFASNNRVSGTASENEATVKGSISHFGHYSVNDGDIDFKIEYSTFPNWNAAEQQRHFTIGGDKLSYQFIPPGSKDTVRLVWQQMK